MSARRSVRGFRSCLHESQFVAVRLTSFRSSSGERLSIQRPGRGATSTAPRVWPQGLATLSRGVRARAPRRRDAARATESGAVMSGFVPYLRVSADVDGAAKGHASRRQLDSLGRLQCQGAAGDLKSVRGDNVSNDRQAPLCVTVLQGREGSAPWTLQTRSRSGASRPPLQRRHRSRRATATSRGCARCAR